MITTRSFIRPAALASLLSACSGKPAGTPVSCDDCRISVRQIAEIGSADDSVALSGFSRTTVGPDGYYNAPNFVPGTISVYGFDGQFKRLIGRDGGGPGEFRGPVYVIADDDSIHTFDLQAALWTVIDQTGRPLRSTRVPRLGNWLSVLRGGELAIAGVPRAGLGGNKPLHIISPDGTLHPFGPVVPSDSMAKHWVAPARDGGLWTVKVDEYQLAKWSASGELERTITLTRPWLTPREDGADNRAVQEGVRDRNSFVSSVWERPDGVWIVFGRVRPKWKAPKDIPILESGFADPSVTEKKYAGYIEVLDIKTLQLVATGEAPKPFKFMNDSLGYAFRAGDDGEFTQRIFKLTMNR